MTKVITHGYINPSKHYKKNRVKSIKTAIKKMKQMTADKAGLD